MRKLAYNANTNWENEEKYLNNLIAGGGGNATWAQNQMKELNAAKAQYGTSTPTSTVKSYSTAAGGAVTNPAPTVKTQPVQKSPDYSTLINQAILNNSGADVVRDLVAQRDAKISADPTLEKYRTDDTYKRALDYISVQDASKSGLAALEAELQNLYAANGAMNAAAEAEHQAKINAVKNAIARLEGQKTDVNDSYDAMQRQLYINREKNRKNIQQQMAAAGLTGGAAESTLLGLNTDYEEGLRQGEQQRAKTINDIEQGIADTQMSGDIEAAQTLYERTKANTDSYAAALQTLMANQAARDEQAAAERKNAQSRAYSLALEMLQSGMMPSSDILATAGLDTETAQSIKAGSDTSSYSAQQFDLALNAAVNGNRDDSIRRILEGYSGMPMESVLAAYGYSQSVPTAAPQQYTPARTQNYTPSYTPKEETSNRGTIGYDEDEGIFTWNGKRYSSIETLQNALNSAKLTSAEEAKLKRALSMYGFNA